jgi:hypothetical protein
VTIEEMNESKPLKTHRKDLDDIETGEGQYFRDKFARNLFTERTVSGV